MGGVRRRWGSSGHLSGDPTHVTAASNEVSLSWPSSSYITMHDILRVPQHRLEQTAGVIGGTTGHRGSSIEDVKCTTGHRGSSIEHVKCTSGIIGVTTGRRCSNGMYVQWKRSNPWL